ncbi:MAG: response regulator [Deltaproteobacteria bacterium]|nr:response regulator [Deltaproteobacteria bacterium]MBW2018443.1 response regulator [Deltaproteobacteria bacterium]MBW2073730.1 response regulator [Deltaproteobacteria bacterium]RLB83602.1 MAG: response regulator [Deltaproteobacteria bacterium]
MSDGLDVIIVDDDANVCEVVSEIISRFYTWGDVLAFTDADEAKLYCLSRDIGVAIFVVDVFLGEKSAFYFLDAIAEKFPMAQEDAIIITGNANDDVVNMCIASDINYLLEKPIKPYALQLAVRAIVTKYLKFAKKLLRDPAFSESVSKF